MSEHKIPIPGRIYNASGGNVCGTDDIIDDAKGKKQSQINTELDSAIQNEIERATEAESNRYTKSEVYKKEETYNKNELNSLITTPNQEYVTVVATDQTTAATDVLPATGSADTIYRVGNWDGTQYDESVYTEYAWNGSAYVRVGVKSQVGEVYDISLNHAGATYADLTAALGTNGANIPVSLRKGGMSVKFVQSSDNKYVQARCMAQNFTTDVTQWQGVDDEPKANSKNLVESGGVAKQVTFDISEANNGETYINLSNALGLDGYNIPINIRRGGMSVKFIQTSINRYLQYRLMANDFTTDITKWQGTDEKPTRNSINLVESGGVYGDLLNTETLIEGIDDVCGIEYFREITTKGWYDIVQLRNPIKRGCKFIMTTSLNSYLVAYDENKDVSTTFRVDKDTEYTAPYDIYYMQDQGAAGTYKFTILTSEDSFKTKIENLENVFGEKDDFSIEIKTNYYGYMRLPRVIKAGKIFKIETSITGTAVVLWDEAKTQNLGCENGFYVKATFDIAYAQDQTKKGTIDFVFRDYDRGISKKFEEYVRKSSTYMFDRILCIGDSRTAGAYDISMSSSIIKENYGYPHQMSKMLGGATMINAGQSGATTFSYWQNKPAAIDTADADAIFVWLGINDQWFAPNNEFSGTSDDVDLETYPDYHNFPNTSCGNLGKIIQYAREKNPHAYVYLSTLDQYGGRIGTFAKEASEKIRGIAQKLDCFLVDLYNDTILQYEYNRNLCWGIQGCHMTTVGYNRVAKVFVDAINNTDLSNIKYVGIDELA